MRFDLGRRRGHGRGRRWRGTRGRKSVDSANVCICPKCGFFIERHTKLPCFRTPCPRCGSPMTRRFLTQTQ